MSHSFRKRPVTRCVTGMGDGVLAQILYTTSVGTIRSTYRYELCQSKAGPHFKTAACFQVKGGAL